MTNASTNGNGDYLLRPRYFPRQVVTAADLTAEQEYLRERMRRHNRLLHGFGVVRGLEVTTTVTENELEVQVSPGLAIALNGDEILVAEAQSFPLDSGENAVGDCLSLDENNATSGQIYLVIRYTEEAVSPVATIPERCAPTRVCEPSRWRDGFTFVCLQELPALYQETTDCVEWLRRFNAGEVPAQEDEDPGSDVLLACLTVERDETGSITDFVSDMSCRKVIHSVAMLQEVIRCLPTQAPPAVPARPIRIFPQLDREFNRPGTMGPVEVTVEFDKPLREETVNERSITVELIGGPFSLTPISGPVQGTVNYTNFTRTATFRPQVSGFLRSGNIPLGSYRFTVTVRGDGDSAIIDADGLRLDGNGDGREGGDFQSNFTIIVGDDLPIEPHSLEPHSLEPHTVSPHSIDPHSVAPHGIFAPQDFSEELHNLGPGPFHLAIEDLPGITESMAEILRENEIPDAVTLINTPVDLVAELLDISDDAAEMLVRIARGFEDV